MANWSLAWAIVLAGAIMLTAVAGAKPWPTPPGALDPHWRPGQCESPRFDHVVIEFQNTWSNLAYLAAGLFILCRRPRLPGIMVGVNLVLLALFSGWYHASLQPLAQSFDVGWIYAVLLSILAYAFAAGRAPLAILPAAFGLTVSILKANHLWHVDSTTFTICLLAILAVPAALALRDFAARPRLLYTCSIALPALLCAIFKLGDGRGRFLCNPAAPIQAHALWHVFGAVALAMTYNVLAQARDRREAILPPYFPHPPAQ